MVRCLNIVKWLTHPLDDNNKVLPWQLFDESGIQHVSEFSF